MIIIPGGQNTFLIYMIVLGAVLALLLVAIAIARATEKKKIKQLLEAHPDAAKIYFKHVGNTHAFVQLIDGAKPTRFSGNPNGALVIPGNHTLQCKWSVQISKNQFKTLDGSLESLIEPNKSYRINYDTESKQFSLEDHIV